ncbi:MAG: hypothetical protein M5U25_17440 [Planctomycetota bacterium]|nr:hypothetical protein [Planctomycetota bacterium]
MMSNSGQGEEQQQSSGILPPAEHLESVEAVFRAFDPANPLWGAGRVGSWVFRGESKAHELKPSAWRKETLKHPNWAYSLKLAGDYAEKWMRQCFEKLPPIAHRLSRQKDDDNKRSLREWATQLVTQIHWERLLQDRFVELADELGIDVAMGGPQFPADARHYPFHRDKLISPSQSKQRRSHNTTAFRRSCWIGPEILM